MRRYSYQRNKKTRKEKIGFFTAFSVCIVAVALALWSTYASIGGFDNQNVTEPTYIATLAPVTEAVNNYVTGVTVTEPAESTAVWTETQAPTIETTEPDTTAQPYTGENGSLQTILQVSASLDYPVMSGKIVKEYSEDAIYSETMEDYRAHTGVDFEADIGENVIAMSDGVVDSIYTDNMYGNVIKVTHGNFSIYYCGVSETMDCVEGGQINRGDIIGKVGNIPCEQKDGMHLHIEVRVGDKTIDPLTVISNNQ